MEAHREAIPRHNEVEAAPQRRPNHLHLVGIEEDPTQTALSQGGFLTETEPAETNPNPGDDGSEDLYGDLLEEVRRKIRKPSEAARELGAIAASEAVRFIDQLPDVSLLALNTRSAMIDGGQVLPNSYPLFSEEDLEAQGIEF